MKQFRKQNRRFFMLYEILIKQCIKTLAFHKLQAEGKKFFSELYKHGKVAQLWMELTRKFLMDSH